MPLSGSPTKVLVTGATGFIGSHLCRALVDREFHVLALSRSAAARGLEHLRERSNFQLVTADIKDGPAVAEIIKSNQVKVVFHLAVAPQVPGADDLADPVPAFHTNTAGTFNLLQAAYTGGVQRFIYSSTIDVYSQPPSYLPVDEDHPAWPPNTHGATKLAGELLCRAFARSLPLVVLRYSVTYGQGEPQHHAIPTFIAQALRSEAVTIYGDGRQSNDFVRVEDVVTANLVAVDTPRCETYNIGSGQETRISELAETIIRLTNSRSQLKRVNRETNKPFRFALDISKAREVLGYSPSTLEHGLREYINQLAPGLW